MIDIQWKIGGEAGFGIMTTGLLFAKSCMRAGFNAFNYSEYPSLIRGGHNTVQTRVSDNKIYCQVRPVDILVALNKNTIDRHKEELADGAAVIYDKEALELNPDEFKRYRLCGMPWAQIIKENELLDVMKNNIALGASLALLDIDLNVLFTLIEDTFGQKGKAVADANKKAAKAGYDYAKQNFSFEKKLPKVKPHQKIFASGAEALALGAIAGGVQFYAGYPMTPSTGVLHYMVKEGPKHGVVVKHAEDEISVANMTVGAGFAGARSMCATSGGGFCLMTEAVGLAGVSETPVVIVNVMRPGPATGIPTWTGQGDIRLVRGAGQDDFPRIILAAGDIEESFEWGWKTLNLAERFQTVVLLLSDKYIAESNISIPPFDASKVKIERGKLLTDEKAAKQVDYKRYKITEDGLSERAIPGQKGCAFLGNSYEHDEIGSESESAKDAMEQRTKRARKFALFAKEMPLPKVYGDKDATISIMMWGSTKMPVLQAIEWLQKEGIKVNAMQVICLNPFPSEQVSKFIKAAKKIILIEGNETAQLGSLIAEHTCLDIKEKYLKYDGRPFYPEDIVEKVKQLVK